MNRTLLTVCFLIAAIAAPFLRAATFWIWSTGQPIKEVATHAASPVVECVLIFLVAGALSLWVVQMEHSRSVPLKPSASVHR